MTWFIDGEPTIAAAAVFIGVAGTAAIVLWVGIMWALRPRE